MHSTEGLNDMVYNRCVSALGIAREQLPLQGAVQFSELPALWQDWDTEQYKLMRNPEVSVRSRGVMEKCTYCIQRITHGRIASRRRRTVRYAMARSSPRASRRAPADAIVFGDLELMPTRG